MRNGKIVRTYEWVLPKFDLILPKFYFGPPWGIFVFSVAIGDFLRGGLRPPAQERHFPKEYC